MYTSTFFYEWNFKTASDTKKSQISIRLEMFYIWIERVKKGQQIFLSNICCVQKFKLLECTRHIPNAMQGTIFSW